MTESMEFRPSNVKKRDEKLKKKQVYLQELHLRNFERNAEYYKITFEDPLLAIFREGEEA